MMELLIGDEVRAAVAAGRPVVALESAVITHGLPFPVNLETARRLEAIVREAGAIPATVGIIAGRPRVGLSDPEIERLAIGAQKEVQISNTQSPIKVSLRDLGRAAVERLDGGTTVAATAFLARRAGLRVFATGGIGGVHRGQPFDISADLPTLATTPLLVVSAGAKSLLDLPLTLEWLETHGVPVVGYQTDEFPAFYSRRSGLRLEARVDTPAAAAALAQAHWALGLTSAVLLAVPVPPADELPADEMETAITAAVAEAEQAGITGKDLTPFILARVSALTDQRSLTANLALLSQNARVAAEIAVEMM